MRVLFVTSEAYPLIKTGGLADVSGALPTALHKHSVDIKILIPGYLAVLEKVEHQRSLGSIQVFKNTYCELIAGVMPNTDVEVFIIKNTTLFERDGGPYISPNGFDWDDNPRRFGVLSRVASLISTGKVIPWTPDVVHCNDWQSGLTPCYMKLVDHSAAKSLLSIHNLAYQGNFHPDWRHALELPEQAFGIEGYEFYGQLSFLKSGVFYADKLSTVSPNYAQEIQTDDFGFGLQGLLKTRQHDLEGILNGIDTEEWNPTTDPYLPHVYNDKQLSGKSLMKAHIQKTMHLAVNDKPLLGLVSRLAHQKGIDMVIEAMPEIMQLGCQFVILGGGEHSYEQQLKAYASLFPEQLAVNIGYNEQLSHQIMAAVDLFVMPSRFEPCGLNQLYGLRYGTPSVVTNTGGLADSICNTTDESIANNTATGFVMENVTKLSLLVTIQHALSTFKNKKLWASIQKNGMKKQIGWENSASAYLALYNQMIKP